MVELSVVISYYKALDNLKLILSALNRQSSNNFEVILSEDDCNPETTEFLINSQSDYKFPIIHLHQDVDNGFRKNLMLNRAIISATSDKIAFIDGDCIPHKHFVKQYITNIDDKSICIGRSVMLDEKITEKIKSSQSIGLLNMIQIFLSNSSKKKEGLYVPLFRTNFKLRGLVGRNWGASKSSLIAVNGFDVDYTEAGVGEDVDIEWRLLKSGLKKKSVKNKAIVYHLHHKRWYSSQIERANYEKMQTKMKIGNVKCINGIASISE